MIQDTGHRGMNIKSIEQVEGKTSLAGRHYRTGMPIEVTIASGRIEDIRLLDAELQEQLPWIGPGLVDLQINGFAGKDVNQAPLAKETVMELTRDLWKKGVTTYYQR